MASVADTPELRAFWEKYQPHPPTLTPGYKSHELIQLTDADGVRELGYAPAQDVRFGKPPSTATRDDSMKCYIWIIDRRGIPYIFEQPLPNLNDCLPKHTNLTGGGQAHIGGELWFADEESIFLSGGSSRYKPRNVTHLNDAVGVFKSYGYRVTSLGWDYSRGRARRDYDGG